MATLIGWLLDRVILDYWLLISEGEPDELRPFKAYELGYDGVHFGILLPLRMVPAAAIAVLNFGREKLANEDFPAHRLPVSRRCAIRHYPGTEVLRLSSGDGDCAFVIA
jgi:hypothetical protein